MGVVVLIGFSCTGKSTMVNDLREDANFNGVEFVDTDQLIAAEAGGNIFRVFLNRVEGDNRRPALDFIEAQENAFLSDFSPQANCVIAAGPSIPNRTLFGNFISRTNATCIWLSISGQTAAARLVARQERIANDNPEMATNPNFGSWNFPHLVSFDADQGRYIPIANERQRIEATQFLLTNVFEPVYEGFGGGRSQRFFVELPERRDQALVRLRTEALRN